MKTLADRRIMVVEDIFDLAMEAKAILESVGAHVVGPFASSADALKSLHSRAPDCAVLDINLGQGTSFELARTLRMQCIPFLFFTGYDREALPPEFADVEQVEKPVDPSRLLHALAIICRDGG